MIEILHIGPVDDNVFFEVCQHDEKEFLDIEYEPQNYRVVCRNIPSKGYVIYAAVDGKMTKISTNYDTSD